MKAKLKEIGGELRQRMHQAIPEQGAWLEQVVTGYFAYHAVPTNWAALNAFRAEIIQRWRSTLGRRSEKGGLNWDRMRKLADDWLPQPRILHPWPNQRFAVIAGESCPSLKSKRVSRHAADAQDDPTDWRPTRAQSDYRASLAISNSDVLAKGKGMSMLGRPGSEPAVPAFPRHCHRIAGRHTLSTPSTGNQHRITDHEVYNGDRGIVQRIDQDEGELIVTFDGRDVSYGFGELDELILAYAMTIHKSQGSEYPAVVIPLVTQHYMMLARNLVYTSVTRGKRLVVLVGQRKALAIAVRKQGSRQRWGQTA